MGERPINQDAIMPLKTRIIDSGVFMAALTDLKEPTRERVETMGAAVTESIQTDKPAFMRELKELVRREFMPTLSEQASWPPHTDIRVESKGGELI